MCGIVGYVGEKQSVPVLVDGLSKLEYRGYDSAGISVINKGEIKIVKQKGRLKGLEEKVSTMSLDGNIGIGHTRWATHGEPNDTNSHPHISKSGYFSIVHNGIIENYMKIKSFLVSKGYTFMSDTDTEVIAQLLEYNYEGDFKEALMKTINELEGSYAIGAMCKECSDYFMVARKDSPLIIGLGKNENFVASDIPAIIKYTRNMLILDDNEIAKIEKEKVTLFNNLGNEIEREPFYVDWDFEAAEKSGYEHFMMKEMCEEPKAVKACISPRLKNGEVVIEDMKLSDEYFKGIRKVYIVACGTAYHAGVIGKYIFEKCARVSVEVDVASEFRYRDPLIEKDDLVIIISQSGETIDTLFALREAKSKGAKILSIVNVVGSSIARESDNVFYTYAGPEIAVASTKAYNTQLTSLYLLCAYISKIRGTVSNEDYTNLVSEIEKTPEYLEEVLNGKVEIQKFASEHFNASSIFYIGRGIDYALSMEGSLKLKEISYIHSEAYAGGELKHGTIALIEKGTLVVCSLTQDELYEKMVSNIREVKSRGAVVLAITANDDEHLSSIADSVIKIPKVNPKVAPIVAITPMQLFAYYMAVLKGTDVDKPRNLAKSVTVE